MKHISVTGYYCTGSSAVVDLLKEYEEINVASPVEGDYEHLLLYANGGFFDLASILMGPYNSVYNSDAAINNFLRASKRLNDNDFGWYGTYEKYYGHEFMNFTYEFVNSISKVKERKGTGHVTSVKFSLLQAILHIGAHIVYKRPINKLGRKYVYDNNPCFYAMPTKSEFEAAAKRYTRSYMNMCSKDGLINVFDHLLWPQQCGCLQNFFCDGFKVVVVERDPRDVYLLNKYYWHKPPVSVSKPYFPTDVEEFCIEWKQTIKRYEDNNILYIYFEDLIYKYEETKSKIERFLGLSDVNHKRKLTTFNPENSIENTQVFNISEEWKAEVKLIEEELKDYIYQFPYMRVPDKSLWFDTPGTTNMNKTKKKGNK